MASDRKTLSVFVDESGSFDSSVSPSRFYVVSCVFHNQAIPIGEDITRLEHALAYIMHPGVCLHSGPLIRREEAFRNTDIQIRRKLFGCFVAFARRVPVWGRCFCIDKRYAGSSELMAKSLVEKMTKYFDDSYDTLSRFDKIKIYYDNGQPQVKSILKKCFSSFPVEFPSCVTPERYRLFQVADLACTVALLKEKLDLGLPLTKSESYFFHNAHDLKKDYIRPLSRLLS